jgi:hypothetical protein
MTTSHTCLTPSTDPHRKRRDGPFISQSVRSARLGSSLRVGASEELCPASGLGSGLHRAGACSAGAPRWRECREKGPANDEHHEYPARTAMRPVEPGPPKRTVPPDGMRALDGDTHPLAPPCGERRRAGSRPAQRRRTWAHAARTPTPPGAETPAERPSLAEPLPRPQKVSPRLPRRDPPGFRSWTAVGWFSKLPTTRRTLTGDIVPGGSPILSIAFPREHELQSPLSRRISVALG